MPTPKKISLIALFGSILIIGGFFSGCKRNTPDSSQDTERPSETTKQSVVSLNPSQVDLANIESLPVERGNINLELTLNGEVEFNGEHLIHITSPVAGVIRMVAKTLGDRVEAGTVLLVLDSRELASAKSEFLAARQRLKLAQKNFERVKGLWEDKIAAEREYLEAQQNLAEKKIVFQTAEQALLIFGLSSQEVDTLVQSDHSTLGSCEIRAPIAGTLVEQQVTEGAQVQPDKDLFVLTPIENMWVMANVNEEDVSKIKPEQTGTVFVQAYPGREFNGKVTWIADAIDEKNRTLPIRLSVPNDKRQLKANMFATIKLVVGQKTGVLTIPLKALQKEPGDSFVFVEKNKGRYERRSVQVGVRSDESIEIKSGLAEGERTVTNGAFILKSELEKDSFGGDD